MRIAIFALLLSFIPLISQADEPIRQSHEIEAFLQQGPAIGRVSERKRLNQIFDYPLTRELGFNLGRMLAPRAVPIGPTYPIGDIKTPQRFRESMNSLTDVRG